jgi:hypothetical protein
VHGQRRITADTALRLARYFGTSDCPGVPGPVICTTTWPSASGRWDGGIRTRDLLTPGTDE